MKISILNYIKLLYSLLVSKCFVSPSVKIIRAPYFIKSRNYIKFGKNFNAGVNLRIDVLGPLERNNFKLFIGNDVQVNDYVHIGCYESIKIGNDVLIGSKVLITDHNHGNYSCNFYSESPLSVPVNRKIFSKSIIIEKNVWICDNVTILPGSFIGEGSIIGANSVVNDFIPPFTISVGIPAKPVKKYDFNLLRWIKINT